MKLFISQPMGAKTKEEIKQERQEAIDTVIRYNPDKEVVVLDSYFEDYNPEDGCVPLKYLAKSLEVLADADKIYLCQGWSAARGCRVEALAAELYGIERAGYIFEKPVEL